MTPTLRDPFPPDDGQEWEGQCARCGSSVERIRCDSCEDGIDGHDCGEDTCCCLHPLDNVVCDVCGGHGGWWACPSSVDHCEGSPLPGALHVDPGTIEWYVVPRATGGEA